MLARIAWVAMLAGCSYLQIDRPPRAVRATDALPACTAERTWPVVDAALAVGGVIGGIGIASGAIEPTRTAGDGTMTSLSAGETTYVALAAILEGVLFAWSSYYGYQTTGACRDLRARMPPPPPASSAPVSAPMSGGAR